MTAHVAYRQSPFRQICLHCRSRLFQQSTRTFITARSASQEQDITPVSPKQRISNISNASNITTDDPAAQPPRWMRTPSAMKQPYRPRPSNKNMEFSVNEDPVKLDRAIGRMLGTEAGNNRNEGGQILDEEVKWLAVTHKSFDQGRRGFNDRLAFLGKRILELQTSLALLDSPSSKFAIQPDLFGRTPPSDPALDGIENVSSAAVADVVDKRRLADLAQRYGLHEVIRWKPKQVRRLKASGIETVLAQTVFAIVGAVALRQGGATATSIVRERVLRPLGLLAE